MLCHSLHLKYELDHFHPLILSSTPLILLGAQSQLYLYVVFHSHGRIEGLGNNLQFKR